jgi:hypothetical protein
MELEDQATKDSFQAPSIKLAAEAYLRNWPRDFWDDL